MHTTTIQRRAQRSAPAGEPVEGRPIATTRRSPSEYALPPRFDVHQVDRVRSELDGLARCGAVVHVDGSFVEMIDLAGLAALHQLVTDHTVIRLERPSTALRATANLTGNDRVSAAISFDRRVDAA